MLQTACGVDRERMVRRGPAFLPWRLVVIFSAVAFLFWLPLEDVHSLTVQGFAAWFCWLAAWRWGPTASIKIVRAEKMARPTMSWLIRTSLALAEGVFFGLLVAPLAVLLMLLKSGLHGHPSPDFSLEQVQEVLWRVPLWCLVGALLKLGTSLLKMARET